MGSYSNNVVRSKLAAFDAQLLLIDKMIQHVKEGAQLAHMTPEMSPEHAIEFSKFMSGRLSDSQLKLANARDMLRGWKEEYRG